MTHDIRKFMNLMEQAQKLDELDLTPTDDKKPEEKEDLPLDQIERDAEGRAKHDHITMTHEKDKVVAQLTHYESGRFTNLAKKVLRIKELSAEIKTLEEEVKAGARADIADLFGAKDVAYTRVIETRSFILTLTKDPKPSNSVSYASVLKELETHLTPELIAVLETIKKKFTSVNQKAASLSVDKIATESIIEEGVWDRIKDVLARLKATIDTWATGYDEQLGALKLAAGIPVDTAPAIAEDETEIQAPDEVAEAVDYSRVDRIEKQVEYMANKGRTRAYIIANIGEKMGSEEAEYAGDYYDQNFKETTPAAVAESARHQKKEVSEGSLYGFKYLKEDEDEESDDESEDDELSEEDLGENLDPLTQEFNQFMGEASGTMAFQNGTTVYCGSRKGVVQGLVPNKPDTLLVELPNGQMDAFPMSKTSDKAPSMTRKAVQWVMGESEEGGDIAGKNLKAIMALWNHDSSHEITLPSAAKQIIVAKKASNGDKDLYFISLNEPYGDFEGFVVFSNDTCSYYDLTNHTLVRDGQIVTTDARCLDNDLEEVEVEYNFDYQRQGEPDPAGIVAYLNVLQSY